MSTTIRETRRKRGLTLMALAHEVGSSPAWLHYIERYGHVPGKELRARIAAALSVRERDLWPDESAPTVIQPFGSDIEPLAGTALPDSRQLPQEEV